MIAEDSLSLSDIQWAISLFHDLALKKHYCQLLCGDSISLISGFGLKWVITV